MHAPIGHRLSQERTLVRDEAFPVKPLAHQGALLRGSGISRKSLPLQAIHPLRQCTTPAGSAVELRGAHSDDQAFPFFRSPLVAMVARCRRPYRHRRFPEGRPS